MFCAGSRHIGRAHTHQISKQVTILNLDGILDLNIDPNGAASFGGHVSQCPQHLLSIRAAATALLPAVTGADKNYPRRQAVSNLGCRSGIATKIEPINFIAVLKIWGYQAHLRNLGYRNGGSARCSD